MTITRDIVIDLLPLYESGEASADTRAVVEAFLATDAELARIVKAARRSVPVTPAPASPPPAHAERATLERTRKALRRKSWTLGLALFFTLLPFTFAFNGGQISFFMWRDEPGSRLFLLSAAWLWWSYFRQSQAFRKAGW
jgi:anti-sigma factor RsiW